ncbi:DUF3850 domain-containing protein [Nocardioides sp. BP30]|uniref:DUF3850 domain-containing protein n=1 Tax=Nocardioides sp. BP30 TaxID=3036374 RepID=UPI002468489B|nr:DUF3850 domain-containing protein [Nocardioides sp. BP30]WGL50653.1 DUF3850 domain-containing protein [Nocardioides sp. BP30]
MTEHILKVVAPYFDAVADGSKTFEVRKNDRAYQRGDTLVLWEYDDSGPGRPCQRWNCPECNPRHVRKVVTFVYSGDPRFGGIEPGTVVLALGDPSSLPSEAGGGRG